MFSQARHSQKLANLFDKIVILGAIVVLGSWLLGKPLFYTETSPVVSPFTALTLLLMSAARLAERSIETFAKPMVIALLGIAVGGNISSVLIQLKIPNLFYLTMPGVVATSIMTSTGLILFGCYEILVVFRKTPQSAFILDDILLHLALVPGGVSLLGHWLQNPIYISSAIDPRSGISILEMFLMASFAAASTFANENLFLWKFLARSLANKIIFLVLFANQFIAPVLVTLFLPTMANKVGIELFVMLGGVLATLTFLVVQALHENNLKQNYL